MVKVSNSTRDQEYRVVMNLKERDVGTKEKSSKEGLASAKDLTVKLHEGRDST